MLTENKILSLVEQNNKGYYLTNIAEIDGITLYSTFDESFIKTNRVVRHYLTYKDIKVYCTNHKYNDKLHTSVLMSDEEIANLLYRKANYYFPGQK